jgi:4-amino-4-deoxy-L-arabinose transferase-like glycosyltransferase
MKPEKAPGSNAAAFLSMLYLGWMLPTLNSTRLGEVDELIYARVAQEAAARGHWMPFLWNGQLWSEKPPLLLWLAALTAKLSGQFMESWPYRLWSCLGAALCVYALVRLGAKARSLGAGLFAGALFALQGDLLFHARFFTMDTALLGCALMAILQASDENFSAAGLWLAAAAWIKSWFVLAFFPALLFALWRHQDAVGRRRGLIWMLGLGLLGLASAWAFYAGVYGRDFVTHDLMWNFVDRARGLSNEHGESNWSYYGKWSSRTAAALIPLALAAPWGLLKRPALKTDFISDAAAMLALSWLASLFVIQAQVINYLLPLEAALCLAWAIYVSRSPGVWTAFLALAALLSARHDLDFAQGMTLSLVAALGISVSGDGAGGCISGFARGCLHCLLLLSLFHSAWIFLQRPDDMYKPVAEALIANPASREGQPLLYIGPQTQALNFYSRYDVTRLTEPPKGRFKESALLFDGVHAQFVPGQP